MADKSENLVKKKISWKRKLAIAGGGLVFLLVIFYFAATSAAFLKGVLLPRAGKMLGATITVEDASISPFSAVSLRGLKVTTTGDPIVQADLARVRYSLWDIISGKINVSELTLEAPQVRVIENADGSSNLDPILKSLAKMQSPSPKKSSKPSKPPQLDLKNLALKNAAVRFTQNFKNGTHQDIELASVNISIDQVRNGISGKFNLSSEVNFTRAFKNPATNDVLQTKATAAFEFLTTADLQPQNIKGGARLDILKVQGEFNELAGLNGVLDCELVPTDIKKFDVRFARAGSNLGVISVSGPFDPVKIEGKLALSVSSIDRQVLNLVGLPMGIDFGATTVGSTTQIELSKGGKMIATTGQVNVAKFGVTRKGQTTPTVDLKAAYNVTVDVPGQNAMVQAFALDGIQNQKPLLHVGVDKPMTVSWNTNASANAIGDSALGATLTGLNLADWRAFVGHIAPAGKVDASLKIMARQAGQKIDLTLDSQLSDLSLKFGSNRVEKAGVDIAVRGQVTDFKQINLSQYQVKVSQQKQPAASVNGSLQFNTATQDADVQTTLDVMLPKALALLDRPDVSASAGTLEFAGRITQKNERAGNKTNTTQTVTGNLKLADFTGKYTNFVFNGLNTAFDCNVEVKNQQLQIRRFAGKLTAGQQPGGALDVTGSYDLAKQAGQFGVKLDDLNQNIIGIFAAPSLGNNKLVSVSVNSTVTAKYDAKADSSVKGDLSIANLLVSDPNHQLPKAPVGLAMQLDGSLVKDKLDLRQFNGKLTQGGNAAGGFEISGSYDLKKEAGQAALKFTDINQNGLQPFLAPALGDKTLSSVAINASGTAKYDVKGESSAKLDFDVANLVISDPKNPALKTPLAAKFQLDGGMQKKVLTLRQFQIGLSPTARAKNQLIANGTVDLTNTNAPMANLKVTAESLDVTPFYDLFDSPNQKKEEPASAKAPTSAASTTPPAEPEAVSLPLRQSKIEIAIGRFYLRELAVNSFVLNTQIDTHRVLIKPFQATLNGAPINATADVDLGVPGYQYDLALTADKIPVEPLANTFSPTYKGQAQGNVFANFKIKGAGTTGENLRKNLNGRIGLSFTNANIQIVGPKAKLILAPIALVLNAPELLKSPLNYLTTDIQLGNGSIDLLNFTAHSDAFLAQTHGTIPISAVLTNSPLNQPIDISLPRSIMKRYPLVQAPPNAQYVKLPTFAHLKGTLGNPDVKTDKLVIAGLTVGGVAGGVTGKAGGILKGVGGLLTGQQPGGGDPTGTNGPPATQTNKSSPLDLLKPFLKKK